MTILFFSAISFTRILLLQLLLYTLATGHAQSVIEEEVVSSAVKQVELKLKRYRNTTRMVFRRSTQVGIKLEVLIIFCARSR